MSSTPHIHVLTGGPYHPVAEQFGAVQTLLDGSATVVCRDGAAAFDDLDGCDLFVAAGLHWTGLDSGAHQWPDGVEQCAYHPPDPAQKQAFVNYVASGRPLLAWHGGTGSFDDWPEFGMLLGFRWVWGTTAHSPFGHWRVEIGSTGHPVVAGVEDYELDDELYYAVATPDGLDLDVHAAAPYDGVPRPMIVTAEGGRIPGAGRTAFLANGHDMRALESASFRRAIVNTIGWLLAA
jgi:type 1 glutamine amidotransferase